MPSILLKRIVPFLIALFLGISTSVIFISLTKNKAATPEIKVNRENHLSVIETGSGISGGYYGKNNSQASQHDKQGTISETAYNSRLSILSKPRANYTAEARASSISGTVRLRVTFSASGQVTSVQIMSGLPNGLTEEAVAAARAIKFAPEIKNGAPVSVNKIVEYNFNLY